MSPRPNADWCPVCRMHIPYAGIYRTEHSARCGAALWPEAPVEEASAPSSPPPQPAEVQTAIAKIAKAQDMVAALCKDRREAGAREWIMSIPARPDYDPDLVIADALHAAEKLLRAVPTPPPAPPEGKA